MTIWLADRWFERKRIDDEITLLWEPHVDPLVRCNIWHVRGRDRDALIDSGLGVASLKAAADDLFEKEVIAVATHIHYDHVGSLHEFDQRVMHRIEAPEMAITCTTVRVPTLRSHSESIALDVTLPSAPLLRPPTPPSAIRRR